MSATAAVVEKPSLLSVQILLALLLRAAKGLTLGLYILTYLALVGRLVESAIGGSTSAAPWLGESVVSLNATSIGLGYLLLFFTLEWFLEVPAGAWADKLGTRFAMIVSFLTLAGFFLGFVVLLRSPSLAIVAFAAVATMVLFPISYATFSGNYEIWLKALCPEHLWGRKAFALSMTLFYFFTIIGACISLYFTQGVFVGSSIDAGFLQSASIPYLIGIVVALLAAVAAISIKKVERKAEEAEEEEQREESEGDAKAEDAGRHDDDEGEGIVKRAYGILRKNRHLAGLYWAQAIHYGAKQLLSAILVLGVLFLDIGIGKKIGILVVGLYGPAFLGSLIPALLTAPEIDIEKTTKFAEAELLRRGMVYFAVALLSLAGFGIVMTWAASDWVVLMFGVTLFATRLLHAYIEPGFQHLASREVGDLTDEVKNALISIEKRWETVAAVVVIGVSAAFSALELSPAKLVGFGSSAHELTPAVDPGSPALMLSIAFFAVLGGGTSFWLLTRVIRHHQSNNPT